jgi:hypothetical protein
MQAVYSEGNPMTIEITIQVPDALGAELEHVRDRLLEVVARGLREIQTEIQPGMSDERAIIAFELTIPAAVKAELLGYYMQHAHAAQIRRCSALSCAATRRQASRCWCSGCGQRSPGRARSSS